MEALSAFIAAHPVISHAIVGLLVFGILANLAVWPPPANPRYRALWSFFVRLLILTWDKYGGEWKLPGVVYPSPPPLEPPPAERITVPGEERVPSAEATPPPLPLSPVKTQEAQPASPTRLA